MHAADDLDEPPPGTRYRRRVGPVAALRGIWEAREMVRALVVREFRARYHQTILGMGWAVITPILLMIAFLVFVEGVADIDTGGKPYAVYAYLGLLPWSFFATSASRGGQILVFESSVLNKVRSPREVFPLATIAIAGVDFAVSLLVLASLFVITGTAPEATSVWLPLIFLIQVIFTIGFVLLLSITVVYIRDLHQALPLLLQLGLFITPVAYGASTLLDRVGHAYAWCNPLVGIIESYRQTVLYGHAPPWDLLGPSAITAVALLAFGYAMFKRLETGIADVA